MPGEVAVELDCRAENDMGMRMWDLNGASASKIRNTATAELYRPPVTGIG